MEQTKRRRAIELAKDVLIAALLCSALWLTAKGPLSGLFQEDSSQPQIGYAQEGDRTGGALPTAMVVNLPSEMGQALPGVGERIRYGVQYDQSGCQELFQQVAGVLVETLSSAKAPEQIGRAQWEQALSEQLGVYMDFQGEIPMPVLVGWLSGERTELEATVRRLVLAVWEDSVALYYQDVQDGAYYRCRSEMSDPVNLTNSLTSLASNGAFYAFESEEYQMLDPDTLLFSDGPALNVYTAANPVSGGRTSLEGIVGDLGFSSNSTSYYSTDEQVARSGDDNVRLSDRGVAHYQAGDANSGLLPVLRQGNAGALFDAVETCRQVALSVLGTRCGEARLYLTSVTPNGGGWQVDFGYSLNGVPVYLDRGYAARFQVENGRIVEFTMQFRSYAASGSTGTVLPPRQAAAALVAMGLEGRELALSYGDSGGDALTAGWSARGNSPGEG